MSRDDRLLVMLPSYRQEYGFPGDIVWDTSQPNGLRKTLDWYLAERSRVEKTR